MVHKIFRQKLISVGAKLSLWLVDTLEAARYDSYIYALLKNSDTDYQKYTLSFGFDYDDQTKTAWKVFVLSKENKWKLIELPNPFYKANQDNFYSPRAENKNLTVSGSEELENLA